jgi:hypothetical protein
MLNFSNHHSLKRRFQAVLISLSTFNQDQLFLTKLIDDVITGNQNSFAEPQIRAVILGLYHHQDLASLTEYFAEPEYIVVALAIALCCRGEMQSRSFVAKVSSYLPSSDFYSQLKLANTLAEKGESRAIASSLIPKNTLAYSIYCFLSTSSSWHLVNQGAGEFQISISAIAAAYLGYVPKANSSNQKLGISLGDRLLAAWAGVYDLSNLPANFYPSIQFPEIMSLGA